MDSSVFVCSHFRFLPAVLCEYLYVPLPSSFFDAAILKKHRFFLVLKALIEGGMKSSFFSTEPISITLLQAQFVELAVCVSRQALARYVVRKNSPPDRSVQLESTGYQL